MYTFSDGHIYYSNNVIKVRYDLIESSGGLNIDEGEAFDQYTDIMSIDNTNCKIKSGTPLDSYDSYKLVYIQKDMKKEQC